MRNIKILILPFVLILVGSCSLTEEPESQISPENFFNNQSDAIATINGAYASLQSGNYYGRYMFAANTHGGAMTYSRVGSRRVIGNYSDVDILDQARSGRPLWRGFYDGLKTANTVLTYVPDISMDEELKERILGEAYFLRGMHYLNIVRFFGSAPIVNELAQGADPNDFLFEKSSVTELYGQVISDLEEAISRLDSKIDTEVGRASREAAQAMLMRAYWSRAVDGEAGQSSDWQSAKELGESLLSSFTLAQNYADLFGENRDYNEETLFEVGWVRTPGEGHGAVHATFVPRGSGIGPAQWGTAHARIPFWNTFSDDDKRKPVTFLTETDNGDGTTKPWWEFAIPAPHMKKWIDADGLDFGTTPFNMAVIRGADILLMMAEIVNELNGPTNEAYGYIDQVRNRAGIGLLQGLVLTQEQFRDSVMYERRRELANEGHDFVDAAHFGAENLEELAISTSYSSDEATAIQELKDDLPLSIKNAIDATSDPETIYITLLSRQIRTGDIEWDNHNIRFAIPQFAVDVNPNLAKNDPYRE